MLEIHRWALVMSAEAMKRASPLRDHKIGKAVVS
jgi:hypothetical protein